MKLMKYGLCIVILCLISGCGTILSLNPFYSKNDIVENDNLLGKWKVSYQNDSTNDAMKVNNEEIWIFSKDNEANAYELSVAYQNEQMAFSAVLFKIKNRYFLDLYPKSIDSEANVKSLVLNSYSVLVHTVSEILIEDKNMTIKPLKEEWVKDQIIRKKFNLSYGIANKDTILLTAETDEIKEYLEKNMDGAFGDGQLFFKFERVK